MPAKAATQRMVREVPAAVQVASFSPTVKAVANASSSNLGEAIVKTAMKYLGVRYSSGSSSPRGFDCSGLTSYVYKQNNITLTRSSRSQFCEGTAVTRIADLKKGDLVFFGGSGSSRNVGHVGIVTDVDPSGNSFKFVHAARSGVKVDSSTSAYYSRRYIGARRIIND